MASNQASEAFSEDSSYSSISVPRTRAIDLSKYTRFAQNAEYDRDPQTNQYIWYCQQEINGVVCSYSSAVPTNVRRHLKRHHGINTTPKESEVDTRTQQILQQLNLLDNPHFQSSKAAGSASSIMEIIIQIIIIHTLPFLIIKWSEFRTIVQLLNSEISLLKLAIII